MNKKRTLLTVVAMILVCVLSVMGTVAYLTDKTDPVENTFIAAGGGKLIEDDGALTLQEHEATKVMDDDEWTGKYEIKNNAATKTAQTYDVLPGMVIPKDPYVTITKKTDTPAYLYVEVINNLSFSTMVTVTEGETTKEVDSLDIDSTQWLEINVGGDREVYVYTTDGTNPAIVTSDLGPVYIIEGNKFTVNGNVDPTQLDEDETLTFQAFLAQASIGEETDPAAIFNACFPAPTGGNSGESGEATPEPAP